MRQQPAPDSAAEQFADLFDAHHGAIWSYARRRVDNQAEADDLASDVFATAWRRFDDLPPGDQQRLWLFGVARNALANHRRSLGRQRRLTDRLRRTRTQQTVELVERDDALWQALARLPDNTRDLLIMRAWDEIAVQDIAILLDCTPNAVSLRLRAARAALQTELDAIEMDKPEKDQPHGGDEVLETTSPSTASRGES